MSMKVGAEDTEDSVQNDIKNDDNCEQNTSTNDPRISTSIEIIFLILGCNVLYAYNTFINGLDFFDSLFPGKDAPTNIARSYNIASSLSYIFSLPFIERFSLTSRYYFGGIGIIVCMIFTLIYFNIGTPKYFVVIIVACITAVFSGVIFGTTMGFAGLFNSNCSSMATSGLALGGLITSAARILSKFMNGVEGWFYFGLSVLFNSVSLIIFHFFRKSSLAVEKISFSHVSNDFWDRVSRINVVIRKTWPFVIEASLCMTITLTLFPGYACKIKSKHNLSTSWVTTLVTSSYMVGDFFGRLATRAFSFPSPKLLWIPHVIRLIFFPLYILPIEGVFLEDDIFIYIVTFMLALTGGYWICLCITYTANEQQLLKNEVELAVMLTSFALNLGIFIGSWLTYTLQ